MAAEPARKQRYDAWRRESAPWRRLYDSSRWKLLRAAQLAREPLCAFCALDGKVSAATVCDHVNPHRGDAVAFWSGPFQSLCMSCHSGTKQSIEVAAGRGMKYGADGFPVEEQEPARNSMTHPEWFGPSQIPLTIVCGPPASGKSTFVRERAGGGDLVICMEQIAERLYGPQKNGRRHIGNMESSTVGDMLRVRNDMLGDLMRRRARQMWDEAWLIVSEPRADKRQWWHNTLKPQKIVVMETPAAVCRQRARQDSIAGDARAVSSVAAIDAWWRKYKRRAGDTIVAPTQVGVGRNFNAVTARPAP